MTKVLVCTEKHLYPQDEVFCGIHVWNTESDTILALSFVFLSTICRGKLSGELTYIMKVPEKPVIRL